MGLYNEIKASNYGNAVDIITSATGIKAAVEWVSEKAGVDCGCEARKERWNNSK